MTNETKTGVGIISVSTGELIAWFPEWNDDAREWCGYWYTGDWLARKCTAPEIIPFTDKEIGKAYKFAEKLTEKFLDHDISN